MKNQLQQFHSSEFGSFEVGMLDSKPYFPAAECAKVLGYKNPHDAISKPAYCGVNPQAVAVLTRVHYVTAKKHCKNLRKE